METVATKSFVWSPAKASTLPWPVLGHNYPIDHTLSRHVSWPLIPNHIFLLNLDIQQVFLWK